MLSKRHRISKEAFKTIGNQGVTLHSPLFSVKISFPKDATTKATFVVSAKVSPKAVVRNRLRRRGYETIRELLPALTPMQFIFFLKKEAVTAQSAEFRKQIEAILKKYQLVVKE